MSLTHGTLLGGRIRYAQSAEGFRTGIEPVLLAATIPARAGERVLEAGTGAGAGLLCLAARVAGIICVGLERDPDQARIAAANFAQNGFDKLSAAIADILDWQTDAPFDHVFANPPWYSPKASVSPNAGRAAAKTAAPAGCADWIGAMARLIKPRGSISLIVPAAGLAETVCGLSDAGCGEIRLLPLWPRQHRPAKMAVLQAIKGGKGACTIGSGLILHEEDGAYTEQAGALLKTPLPLAC